MINNINLNPNDRDILALIISEKLHKDELINITNIKHYINNDKSEFFRITYYYEDYKRRLIDNTIDVTMTLPNFYTLKVIK